MDVSRVVGRAIIDSYLNSFKVRLKVDLDSPDVEVYCLVRGNEFLEGVNLTGESLHKRRYRAYEHPASIKPTLASAMLLLSGWKSRDVLIDPMCGGATIPIEAAYIAGNMAPNRFRRDFSFLRLKMFDVTEFENCREKVLESERETYPGIYGMEKYRAHLEGGIKNAGRAQVLEDIRFKLGDATVIHDYPEGDFDFVVVNPPYGIRMIPKYGDVGKLYDGFIRALREVAENSTLVLITAAKNKFRRTAERTGLKILSERNILYGRLNTTLFKCKV